MLRIHEESVYEQRRFVCFLVVCLRKKYLKAFVRQRGRDDGVLALPEDACFVGWAAYLHGVFMSKTELNPENVPTMKYNAKIS